MIPIGKSGNYVIITFFSNDSILFLKYFAS